MEPKLSSLVTWDKGTPPTKSSDTSITWSRDKSKTLYLHIHKVHGPQNLVECWLRWGGRTHKVTWYFNSVFTWQFKSVIFSQPQILCLRNWAGCWLFCGNYDRGLRRGKSADASITLFPSFVKKHMYQMGKKLSRCNGKLVLAKKITKTPTRTKNDEMN